MVHGEWMKPTFASLERGHIYTERSILKATPLTSCLSPYRDLTAAKHFLQLALWQTGQVRPRAISDLRDSGELSSRCRCRPSPYLNNILEQDHRFIKKRIAASLWFRSVDGALNTIAGYESMNMIRKGQVRRLAKGDVVGQMSFVQRLFGIAA